MPIFNTVVGRPLLVRVDGMGESFIHVQGSAISRPVENFAACKVCNNAGRATIIFAHSYGIYGE